jgi:hypothetical protein
MALDTVIDLQLSNINIYLALSSLVKCECSYEISVLQYNLILIF